MARVASTTMVTLIISLLPMIVILGNSMFIPILPNIQDDLSLTSMEASLILTVFSIPAAIIIPIIGVLSDRFGRKKIILLSLMLLMIGSLISAVVPNVLTGQLGFSFLLFGRFLQGVGAGGTTPMGLALAGDYFEGEKRNQVLGLLEVFGGLGKVISPIIGAIVAVYFWYASFYLYLFVALLLFIGIFYWIEGKGKTEVKSKKASTYFRSVTSILKAEFKWITPIYLAGGVGMFLLFGLLFYMTYELEANYAIFGLTKGLFLALPFLALTIFSYRTGKKLGNDPNQVKRFLFLGMLLIITAFSLLIFFSGISVLLIAITIVSIGLGLFLPAANSAVTASVSQAERGLVVSLYSMTRVLGVAFGPMFFGMWLDQPTEIFFKALFLSGVALILLMLSWTCVPLFKNCPTF